MRKRARAVEWDSFENYYTRKGIGGSNPPASARSSLHLAGRYRLVPAAIKNMFKFLKKTKEDPEDMKEVLEYLKKLEESYQELSQKFESFKEKSKKDLQKVGMIRFNPFPEVGGDQSFSIAVLDADNNGFVITSHYLRELNRVYAKPIEKGISKYQLSKEEIEAINKAIHE